MPHTNRKKKGASGAPKPPKIVHTKRQLLDDDEGWTHVVDSKKSTRAIGIQEIGLRPWEGDFVSGKTATVNIIYEEVVAEHTRFTQQWEDSEACTNLKAQLASWTPEQKKSVTNIVCLGLGTLQDWKLQTRRTSHTQLAALQTIISALGLESVKKVTQEPRATDLDRKFLESLNFESLEDPEGYKRIDEGSLVYAIHCYPALYQQVSKQLRPAVMVANDLNEYAQYAK